MSKRHPYSKLSREGFLKLLAERALAPLVAPGSPNEVVPTAQDGAGPMYRHYPRMAALFPYQRVCANELFLRGLVHGFAHSFWYDSVGSMVEHLVPLGRTLRAIGAQHQDVREFVRDFVAEVRSPDFIRDVLADPARTLPWLSFNEVYILVEIAGVHAIVEISSDTKCSSFGFLAPETSPEEAFAKLESMVVERHEDLSNIIPLDQMKDPKSQDVELQVVELPPSAFIKGQLKFNGAF